MQNLQNIIVIMVPNNGKCNEIEVQKHQDQNTYCLTYTDC